jgi:hypothetical protein
MKMAIFAEGGHMAFFDKALVRQGVCPKAVISFV